MTLHPGMEFREVHRGPASSDSIFQVRCDPARTRLGLVWAKDYGQSVLPVAELTKRSGCWAAVNGGYFDPKSEPMGYQRDAIRVVSHDLRTAGLFGGVFVVGPRGADLLGREDFVASAYSFALQCGPRLIFRGEKVKGIHADPPARRTGMGVDRQGRIFLYATGLTARFTFAQTQAWLNGPVAQGGLEPSGVLNLDGGSSTQFSVNTPSLKEDVPGWARVPVAVGIFPSR